MTIEIVVYNLESALMAKQGGADRIELCDNPGEGGTTPSLGMIQRVREKANLDLFVITNGSHWNGKIEKLINDLNFDVAISIDAFDKEKVERIRKNVVYEKLLDNINRFSEICTRKGKHLSLSFTVQKDNWEQLPLIINLCNKVNAYIYISFVFQLMYKMLYKLIFCKIKVAVRSLKS